MEHHYLSSECSCSFFIPQDLINFYLDWSVMPSGLVILVVLLIMEVLLTLPKSDLFCLTKTFHSSVCLHVKLLVNVS